MSTITQDLQAKKDSLHEQLRGLNKQEDEQLVGQTYNGRRVIAGVGSRWLVCCSKGHEKVLSKGKLKRFGCKACQLELMRKDEGNTWGAARLFRTIDMMGRTIGSRTVIAQAPRCKGRRETYWLTRCTCGYEAEVPGGKLREGKSIRCITCANRLTAHHGATAIRVGALARKGRCTAPDSFGEKKREIQRMFWSVVPIGPALVFVDRDTAEWQMMIEADFAPEHCAIVADVPSKIGQFVERCNFQNLPLPEIRKGFNLTATCKRQKHRVSVTQWLQTELEARGRSAFSVAHLDFFGTLRSAQPAIDTFLQAGLLTEHAVLAITISYRGDDWLRVWHTLTKFMGKHGLRPWSQLIPYNGTGTPMLFSTFQKTG